MTQVSCTAAQGRSGHCRAIGPGRWSTDAALRALRAVLVVPTVFALADQVVGSRQIATYAAFGGFATLVMTTFGGTRRDKAVAHLGLALAGSAPRQQFPGEAN
jgi:hypothetical protein